MGDRATPPIGVFDSGVGGLTVLRSLLAHLPRHRFIYLGDTARVPYGNKAPETVQRYSVNLARTLHEAGCGAIVIACNTASAFAVDAVRKAVALPVFDVVLPVARVAAAQSEGHVAVLGTRGTVKSAAYVAALRSERTDLRISQRACPLFVPLSEEGWTRGEIPRGVVARYLLDLLRDDRPDTLILGCTHYPLLAPLIEELARDVGAMGATPSVRRILDSADATAGAVAAWTGKEIEKRGDPPLERVRFLVTDDPEQFRRVGSAFLGETIAQAEHIDVVDAG